MATKSAVTITRQEAIDLLVDTGFKKADGYSDETLAKRLKALPEALEASGKKPTTPETKETWSMLSDALSVGSDVKVVDKGTGKASAKKSGKAEKAGKKAGKAAKAADKKAPKKSAKKSGAKKEGAATDGFGSRKGSNTAKINEVLTREYQTMSEIMEAAGVAGTCYDHLNRLIDKGYVEKGGEGGKQFRLTKTGSSAQK